MIGVHEAWGKKGAAEVSCLSLVLDNLLKHYSTLTHDKYTFESLNRVIFTRHHCFLIFMALVPTLTFFFNQTLSSLTKVSITSGLELVFAFDLATFLQQ